MIATKVLKLNLERDGEVSESQMPTSERRQIYKNELRDSFDDDFETRDEDTYYEMSWYLRTGLR